MDNGVRGLGGLMKSITEVFVNLALLASPQEGLPSQDIDGRRTANLALRCLWVGDGMQSLGERQRVRR